MLELTRYSIHDIENLNDFIIGSYVIIDDIYKEVTPDYIKNRRNINDSIISDSEIITISIVGELLMIPSEKAWLSFVKKNLRSLFPRTCDRSRFNRTRRNLKDIILLIRERLFYLLGYSFEKTYIIDSMPIPVCHFGRAVFHKTFQELATYGYCASKKETYYGFKLHVLANLDGYIAKFCVTPANIDDRAAVWDLTEGMSDITILGDKGYISRTLPEALKQEQNIQFIHLKRKGMKTLLPKSIVRCIGKLRRRVETTFSQLANQLSINKVLAKSMDGFKSRIATKLLAHNLCYFINKALGKTIDIGKIKELIY